MAVTAADRGRVIVETDTLLTADPGRAGPVCATRTARRSCCMTRAIRRSPSSTAGGGVRSPARSRLPSQRSRPSFGTQPADIVAGVGPSIGPCCYEVGDEVVAAARDAFENPEPLLPSNGSSRRHFDLWAANRRWLTEAGVRQIEVAEICTACHQEDFFSYRGGKGRTGHFGALMMLRSSAPASAALPRS